MTSLALKVARVSYVVPYDVTDFGEKSAEAGTNDRSEDKTPSWKANLSSWSGAGAWSGMLTSLIALASLLAPETRKPPIVSALGNSCLNWANRSRTTLGPKVLA